MTVLLPANELERLAKLSEFDIVDSEAEAFFDEIVGLASTVCDAPIALVTLVDESRQWFKARIGLAVCETPREHAFCAHAILGSAPLVVNDALADSRFADNPLVTGAPAIRGYLGIPLITSDGFALGTLCAIRQSQRDWTEGDIKALSSLALLTMRHIELRKIEREAVWLREVEHQLAATETRFQSIVSNMTEGVVVQERSGMIIWANEAAETILGLSADELYGRSSMDPRWRATRDDGSDFPGGEHYPMVAMQTGKPQTGIMAIEQPNRDRRWLRVSSQPVFLPGTQEVVQSVTTFLDITQQRQSQRALADNEARLKLALDLGAAVAWETEVKDMAFFISENHRDVFGNKVPFKTLYDYLDCIHPDDKSDAFDAWTKHLDGKQAINSEHRIIRSDGSERWIRSYAMAKMNPATGERLGSNGLFLDITHSREQQGKLGAAVERAEAASLAKSAFLANMSHEIRTPLNGVIGLAGALSATVLDRKQREMVGLVENSGRVLERLLSDILDVSKVEAGRFELEIAPFDLLEEIEASAHVMRIRAEEKGIDFNVLYGETARGQFSGDAVRLKQIVSNLVSNAIKFTHLGGVTVRVDVEEAVGETPCMLSLRVEDTGIGFDSEAAATLFERFSQADNTITRRFGGTGLGLAISRAITDLMGGTINAQSEPGKGTVFTVRAPLPRLLSLQEFDLRVAEAVVEPDKEDASDGPPLRILVAEDHPTNQKVIELLLEPHNVTLLIVENGQLCVDAYVGAEFDLILMDMQMPVMDGIAATKEIRRLEAQSGRARTPIAMLSANALVMHQEMASAAGVDHYIAKPISPQGLISGISETLHAASVKAAA